MLWIVGNVFKDFRTYLQERNIPYGVFINQKLRVNPNLGDVPVLPLDFSTPDSLKASASAIEDPVDAIMTAGYENYVLPAAILAEHFMLPGLSIDAAMAATDKAVMRDRFTRYSKAISPAYREVTSWHDIELFMNDHDFPVMLKPTNLMKSLFITKNVSLDELRSNYARMSAALSTINDTVYTLDAPRIIIEECMEGTMHTVAGYADKDGQPILVDEIADCITGHDVGKKENYIYSRQLPTQLSSEHQAAILAVAADGVRALGLRNTMLHIEIMLTRSGPKIIEIGARTGGYRARMYQYACGIDLHAVALEVAFSRVPTIKKSANRSIAVIELFPDNEGEFKALTELETLKELPSLQYVHCKDPRTVVGRSSNGYKAAAIIILGNDDAQQFARDYNFVRTNVAVALYEQ